MIFCYFVILMATRIITENLIYLNHASALKPGQKSLNNHEAPFVEDNLPDLSFLSWFCSYLHDEPIFNRHHRLQGGRRILANRSPSTSNGKIWRPSRPSGGLYYNTDHKRAVAY